MSKSLVQSIQIKRGNYSASRSIVPQNGEMIWIDDEKQFRVGDGVNPGGIDIITEKLIRDLISYSSKDDDRLILAALSDYDMVEDPFLPIETIFFRRDLDKLFVLDTLPSNVLQNWKEFKIEKILGNVSTITSVIATEANWRRIAYLPYGKGSVNIKISSINSSNPILLEFFVSVADSKRVINIIKNSVPIVNGEPIIKYIRISNNEYNSNDGAILDLYFNANTNNFKITITSANTNPEWQIKKADKTYPFLPNSTSLIITNQLGMGSTGDIYEGNLRLSEKYVSVVEPNFNKTVLKNNLGLAGLEVDTNGNLVLNGTIIFSPN